MRLPIAILFSLLSPLALIAAKPRVAIIPWVADGDAANYGYMAASITDALRIELNKRFVFEEMAPERVLKILTKNEMQPEDWATSTVALQLGTWEAQSVVISGKFRIKKKPNGREAVEITANIFSVYEKKRVSQFRAEAEITANMFEPLGKVAAGIAELAKDILPNPEQFRIAEAIELEKVTNIGLIRTRLSFTHFPTAATDLAVTTQVTSADFGAIPGVTLEYRRYAIILPQLGFFVQADADYRKRDLTGRGTTVPATYFMVGGLAGPTYYFALAKSFYVSPTLGLGYAYISTDLTGVASSIYIQTLKTSTLMGEVRTNIGYRVYGNFVMEISPVARFYFYSGKTIVDAGLALSAGYKF